MMKWCAYCQHYIGEKPPYTNFEVTHGICDDCCALRRHKDLAHISMIRPIVEFYKDLRDKAQSGTFIDLEGTISRSKELGIRPLDMAIGILQPSLNEIGKLFAAGTVTIAHEHAFTNSVDRMISQLFALTPAMKICQANPPLVVLSCVDGNYHWLGLRLLELALLGEGVSTRVFIPSLPGNEIIAQTIHLQPKVLGLSICSPTQIPEVEVIGHEIRATFSAPALPQIAVGGYGVHAFLDAKGTEQHEEKGLAYFRQSLDFVAFIRKTLQGQNAPNGAQP
ncbi:MAG TPA: B12-binding domain-containing protein [Oligoflexus sp.]|uniref:B12-binding domain-containing protein n=1 Tax=Oligoflexus sp. TaxID=1971216 RepID=UPI002D3779D3|nr:B12-binding domain-containing protein [Oligoflexus sp.]HYX33497.1 B12-binding domain-containing protein [Oligoflexus sp.]